MKKFILLLICLCCLFTGKAQAQNGFTHASMKGGWVSDQAMVFTGSILLASKHHGLKEMFVEYFNDWKTDHVNYTLGMAFLPVITRSKNTALRLRAGAQLGTNTERFILAPLLGFELTQSLGGIELVLAQNSSFVFWDHPPYRWRWGFQLGFRIPIN